MDNHDHRKEVCDALEMSFVRVKALRQLARTPMSMGDLAAQLLTDAPYVTVIVDDLEGRGLVRRTANPSDRRSKLVEVTPAGRAAARRADAILDRPPPQWARLTPAERANLEQVVRKLSAPLDDQP